MGYYDLADAIRIWPEPRAGEGLKYICECGFSTDNGAAFEQHYGEAWHLTALELRAARDAELRPEGFYWIKRNEPDGSPIWEPAQFVHRHFLPGGPPVPEGGPCWYVIGTSSPQREIVTPGASNRWQIGDRIQPPTGQW